MERVIKETGMVVENGTHEIYVNTAIDDGTEIAKRMQYFKKSTGVHQKFQKRVTEMCELVEEYAKKYAEEEVKKAKIKTALNLLQNGASVELVVKSLPSLSEQFVRELQAQLL